MLNIFNFNKTVKYELDDSNFFYDYSWFCSLDILDFEDVEINIDGNDNKPYERFLTLANNNINKYLLSDLHVGNFIFNDWFVEGITFNFIYDELQQYIAAMYS